MSLGGRESQEHHIKVNSNEAETLLKQSWTLLFTVRIIKTVIIDQQHDNNNRGSQVYKRDMTEMVTLVMEPVGEKDQSGAAEAMESKIQKTEEI